MRGLQSNGARDWPRLGRVSRLFKLLWAFPCSLIGLALAAAPLVFGGRARWTGGALEVTYRSSVARCGRIAQRLPFRGIVFGHVILAVTAEELAHIGAHERVHVRQYERWGPLFLIAYGASSLWQMLNGRAAYWDNCFEVEAREESRTDVMPDSIRHP